MEKLPWMQFNTGDWLKDPALSMCLPATRGIWIDAIASMHESGRSGTLSGTPCQLARVLRCDRPALMAAIMDLRATGAATVTERHGIITLTNRRMSREASIREANRLRQEKCRGHTENNTSVTPMSPSVCVSLSDSDISERKRESEGKGELRDRFARFWEVYPRHEAKKKAWNIFQEIAPSEDVVSAMIRWIGLARRSDQWQNKTKIPYAATVLDERRWEDDPPPPAHIFEKGRSPDLYVGLSESTVSTRPRCEACEDTGRIITATHPHDRTEFKGPWSLAVSQMASGWDNYREERCSCAAGSSHQKADKIEAT